MEEYFVTFQPQKVAEELIVGDYVATNSDYEYIKKEFGYNPIFFIPLANKLDFLIKNFFSTPSKPDVMIVVKMDKYDCIDAAKWYELRGKEKEHKFIRVSRSDEVEKEFISEKILKNNVIEIVNVNEMISNLQGVNDLNRTKVLMFSQKFWDVLENYFRCYDERDMKRFAESALFNKIIMEYGKILVEHKMSQADTMKWFRNNLTDASRRFDWF